MPRLAKLIAELTPTQSPDAMATKSAHSLVTLFIIFTTFLNYLIVLYYIARYIAEFKYGNNPLAIITLNQASFLQAAGFGFSAILIRYITF